MWMPASSCLSRGMYILVCWMSGLFKIIRPFSFPSRRGSSRIAATSQLYLQICSSYCTSNEIEATQCLWLCWNRQKTPNNAPHLATNWRRLTCEQYKHGFMGWQDQCLPTLHFTALPVFYWKKNCEGTAGKIDTLFSLLKICFLLCGWHMGLIITEINGALACLHVPPACRPRTAKLLTLSFLQGPWKSWWLLRVILVGQETPGKGDSYWKPPS